MFAYYFDLALRSFKRNPVLTALMVLAIALGIGASMTTLTVFHMLSGDPIPRKSDSCSTCSSTPAAMDGFTPGDEPAEQMTRFDAETLLREQARRSPGVHDRRQRRASSRRTPGLMPFYADARYTTADFFAMFEVPFLYGGGWSATEDERARARRGDLQGAQREALRRRQQRRQDRAPGHERLPHRRRARHWRPTPRFYDLNSDRYGELEQVFVPFSTRATSTWIAAAA